MKLTSKEALKMLNNARGKTKSDGWIKHSICVGECASQIALALNLDGDYAKTLGYIHDIGKCTEPFSNHIMNGYHYLKDLGYDEKYYTICLIHSYLNNDCMCTAGGIPSDIPFRKEFVENHDYTIYEKIVCLSDLMCTNEITTMEKRLLSVMIRRGVYENTQYHLKEAFKLKNILMIY